MNPENSAENVEDSAALSESLKKGCATAGNNQQVVITSIFDATNKIERFVQDSSCQDRCQSTRSSLIPGQTQPQSALEITEKIYTCLRCLAQQDDSTAFKNFFSNLKSERLEAKTDPYAAPNFLGSLFDFYQTKALDLSLPTQFFLKKLLENSQSLIENYRQYYNELSQLKEVSDRSYPNQQERDRLLEEIAEKFITLKSNNEIFLNKQAELETEHEILDQLNRLLNDFEAYNYEKARNYSEELAANEKDLNEAQVKARSMEAALQTIDSSTQADLQAAGVEQRWGVPGEIQAVTNDDLESVKCDLNSVIRRVRKKINEVSDRLSLVKAMKDFEKKETKPLDNAAFSTFFQAILDKHEELTEKSEQLLAGIKTIKQKDILQERIENSPGQLGSKEKEKKEKEAERETTKQALEELTTYLKNLQMLLSGCETENNERLTLFVQKNNQLLKLISEQTDIEQQQEKIIEKKDPLENTWARSNNGSGELDEEAFDGSAIEKKLENKLNSAYKQQVAAEKNRLSAEIRALETAAAHHEALLMANREACVLIKKELIGLLSDQEKSLASTLSQLKEAAALCLAQQQEQYLSAINTLQRQLEYLKLLEKINQLTSQREVLKKSEAIWAKVEAIGMPNKIAYIDKTQQAIDKLLKQVDDHNKKLDGSKKKDKNVKAHSAFDKTSIKTPEKTILTYHSQLADYENIKKDYKQQIVECINQEFKKNRADILENKQFIEINKIELSELTKQKEQLQVGAKVNDTVTALLDQVAHVLTEREKDSLPAEKYVYQQLVNGFISLKKIVDETNWDYCGFGFLKKKMPDGVEKLRELLDKILYKSSPEITELLFKEKLLILLRGLLDIHCLIKRKSVVNNFSRSAATAVFYQSLDQTLTAGYHQLRRVMDPGWFEALLTKPTTTTHSFPSEALFTEEYHRFTFFLASDGSVDAPAERPCTSASR